MGTDMNIVFERISEFADLSMWRWGTPGLVIGVTDRERPLFVSAKGYSDATCKQPMSADNLFQIGSVSKSFTCIALLQLAEQGALDLHDPITKYLPWFSISSKHSEITLHHLMTHTAGIIQGSDATPTAWTEVWDMRHTETTCEPGTFYHYSNSGYKTLGLVLETVTGRPYDSVIRDGVLEAAGMRSTEAVITNRIRRRMAVAHQPTYDDRPSNRNSSLSPAPWFEGDTADGSICAPIEDMMAYIRVLLNKGDGPWGSVVSPEGFRLMTTSFATPDDEVHPGGYGYGLNTETVDGHMYIGHQGGMVGHYTSMLMDMDTGFGVMVMINGPGNPEEVARFAVEAVRASLSGRKTPEVPSRENAFTTPNAPDYVGSFAGPEGMFDVVDKGGTLHLTSEGLVSLLEPREHDAFFVDAPAFGLFLMEFERIDGRIARAHHGGRTYFKDGNAGGTNAQTGARDVRYDGHYRSHNPWLSNFRVVKRSDGLVFVLPDEASRPLVPLGKDVFRMGSDERSPERMVFDCIIDGVATSVTVSGGGRFGRTFTT